MRTKLARSSPVGLLALLLALSLPGCGGGSRTTATTTVTTTTVPTQTVKVCSGLTDKCVFKQLPVNGTGFKPTVTNPTGTGCHVVDVSDYQPNVNWSQAAPYICGAVVKAGEGSSGSAGGQHFVTYWRALEALHKWHSGYWFMRGTVSCASQGQEIVNRLNEVGYASDKYAGPFQLDEEVPGANANNLALCVDGYIYRAFHRHAGIYTGPGTWPGGSHGSLTLWQAEYGPTLHTFWTPLVAWQCTDGQFGCVTYIPGVGYNDVSKNFGLVGELPTPPKPKLICFGKHAKVHNKTCSHVATRVAHLQSAESSSRRAFKLHDCILIRHNINRLKHNPGHLSRGEKRALKQAITAAHKRYRQRGCPVFHQRANYFRNHANRLIKQYS